MEKVTFKFKDNFYLTIDEKLEKYFLITEENRFGLLNSNYKILLKCEYDAISLLNRDGYFMISKSGKFGVIDYSGREIIQIIADKVDYNRNDKIIKYSIGNDERILQLD